MRRLRVSFLLLVFGVTAAFAGDDILPHSFAGWTQTSTQFTSDPAQVDSAYPAVLKEYGFAGCETATYTRDDGRKLTIKAARFNDATGGYGAFTFYRQPQMKSERIGTKAASANERILFFRSNVLVDAAFDRVTGMSAAELRELAGMLPAAKGTADKLPGLPEYLPKDGAVENSAKYVVGPQALIAAKVPLTPEQVQFNTDAEVLTQEYNTDSGPVQLTLIQYPTPQIAGGRLRAIEGNGNQDSTLMRRTGPLLVLATGAVHDSAAQKLLNSVNYEAEVTWNEPTYTGKKDNIGNLILAAFALIGILLLIALGFGVLFGGARIVLNRLFPNRVFERSENVEIIQLHLE